MDSNAVFNGAVRASKRVRGISAPPEQPLEHTTKKTRSRSQRIQDIPAFRQLNEGAPPSPRSTQDTGGDATGAMESRNDVEGDSGQAPPPAAGNTSNHTPGEEKKKKNVLRKDTVLTENPRFLVHCRPRPQSGTTTNRLLGGCLETLPRRRHWPGRGTADGPTRVVEENGARNGEYQPTLSQYRPRHQPQELPRTHLERTHRPRPKK